MVSLVLHFTPIPQTLVSRQTRTPPSAVTPNASSLVSRVVHRVNLQTTHSNGIHVQGIKQRGAVVVKASETDGAEAESTIDKDPPSKTEDETSSLSIEKLPLESRLEQKMKMKLAKKIRLRRKRLVRKRQLRKKGRWPPSKMKKNKNV